jgi:TetR/AcrR family transcriptional repressor of multidrug resistance operon
MRPKNLLKEEAIRSIAMQIIAEQGIENLSMQKLASAAGISPRTIYIKYENKEDLLIKLYIEEVLEAYEKAVLEGFDPKIEFSVGVKKLWQNSFDYFVRNKYAFALMLHGKSSPLLNKAYKEKNITEGDYFGPVKSFLKINVENGCIPDFPHAIHRALLFSPLQDLIAEYFDHQERSVQIVTPAMFSACCDTVIKGLLNPKQKS